MADADFITEGRMVALVPVIAEDVATAQATATSAASAAADLGFNVRLFGAMGDGSTDDSSAIALALAATDLVSGKTTFPHGNYATTSALTTTSSVEMLPGARITYTGSGTALTVGPLAHDASVNADIRRSSVEWDDGTDTTSIGLQVLNSNWVRVRAIVHNFSVGVDMRGDALGCSYGVIDCRDVTNNKVNFRCSAINAGWANQHEVRGRTRIDSAYTGVTGSRYVDLTTGGNGSTFIGMSLEGDTPEWTVDCSVPAVMFLNCRWEQATGIRLNTGGNFCHIIGGYSNLGVDSAAGVPITTNGAVAPVVISGLGSQFVGDSGGSGPGEGVVLAATNSSTNIVQTMKDQNGLTRAEANAGGVTSYYGVDGKGGAIGFPMIVVDGPNRRIYLGNGTATPIPYVLGTSQTRLDLGPSTVTVRTLGNLEVDGWLDHDGDRVGFYNTTPIVKPTGVAVTAEAIHAALVALGLIGA